MHLLHRRSSVACGSLPGLSIRVLSRLLCALACLFALLPAPVHASLSIFIGEPFGHWGTIMPLGHAALFLDNACADGPLKVRPCSPNEPRGVVLARYHAIGQYDWLASPVREFLWATNDPAAIPAYATPGTVWALRERFREDFLRPIVPDGTQGHEFGDGRAAGAGSLEEWWESAGMAYNRRVFVCQVRTTPEQDARLIAYVNNLPNRHLYHLKKTNCADFVAQLTNVLFPHAIHNDRIADFGLMTPKQVARSFQEYAVAHPELDLRVYQIAQAPGSLVRSRPIRGGAESGLKTKRYLFPLLVIAPEVPAYLATIYVWHGRWWVGTGSTVLAADTLPPSLDPTPDRNHVDLAQKDSAPASTPDEPSPSFSSSATFTGSMVPVGTLSNPIATLR